MRCSSCNEENPEGIKFCGQCGTALVAEALCKSCGTANPPDVKFCHECGQSLGDATVSRQTTPTPAPALPASFASGRYQVKGFLGEGAKKRVYLASDRKLDRDVAIGVIKAEGLDAEGLTRAHREAQSMGRLGDNPHIVTVHDTGDERGQPYIVMEHMEGGALDEHLQQAETHRLPVEEALRIADQLAQALAHAHEREIVHRDLKPGNVYLTQDGTAKLGDFGFAVALDRSRLTQEGMMVGTASYMAPEQAVGGKVTPRSDLYALGCVLYEMVAGRPPFLGEDIVGVISQHINTAPIAPTVYNAELPQQLDVLIMHLLSKAPEDRPESAIAIWEELRRIAALSSEELAVQPQMTPSGLAALPWGQFVGRHEEMDQLQGALENALSSQGTLAMIVGEPGIGKTRLAEEFAVYASLRGAQVLTGHCYEGEVALPYRPFIEALRQYVQGLPDVELRGELAEGAPEVATLVSEIRQRLPDIPEVAPLEPEAERLRLFESISAFISSAASANPIVLFLDDLQWADKPSLLLLRHLARTTSSDRVLIVGAYRDVELDRTHPLAEVLVTLRREQSYQRVLLRGLPEDDVLGLLRALEPSEETAGKEALATALYQETEGNPLFIREVLSDLVEEGKLVREGGRWVSTVTSISELGIPEGVREVIGRRLSRLSDGCNQLLTLASTMTGGFDWSVITELSSEPEDSLFDLLDEALAARVVRERPDRGQGAYEFTHAIIRQTLYGELNIPRRVSLHRQIGETLERLHADNLEPHLSDLAHHFFQAAPGGDVEKAIGYASRAGDRASDLLAYEEAASQYDLALQAVELEEKPDEERRCEILLSLSEAQRNSGDVRKALETCEVFASLARSLGSGERLARAAIEYGYAWSALHAGWGDPQQCIELLEEALELLPTEDSALRVRALALLASLLAWSAPLEKRQELTREALQMARRVGDPRTLNVALNATISALWGPESVEERLATSDEMLQLAAETGLSWIALSGYANRRIAYAWLGEMERSEQDLEAHAKLAEELRLSLAAAVAIAHRAMHRLFDGQFEEAERLMQQALAQGQSTTETEGLLVVFQAQLANLRQLQGRLDELEEATKGLIEQYPDLTVYPTLLSFIYVETGREEEAKAIFERLATDGFTGLVEDDNWLVSIYLLTEVCGVLRDPRRAADLYQILLPYARLNIGVVGGFLYFGSASRPLGLMTTVMEQWDDAERHFEAALAMDERMGARPWLAYSQYHFGDMLLRRDDPGDRERALELLTASLDTARELGMKRIVERTLALKMELQGVASGEIKTSIDAVFVTVQAEQPDLRSHAAPDGTVTILFSDIESHTAINERLGDQRWMELLREHNSLVREQIQSHEGYEVKTEGDGFMVAFGSARRAVQCAIAIQRAFAKRNDDADETVLVRTGLHTGEPVKENNDFYGTQVTQAARIANEANGGEILVSALLKELTDAGGDIEFSEVREVELKDLGTQQVFGVNW